ncbi:MAG: hypothetical protein EOP10_25150, partial [Proteobacteria bacterium]
MKKTKHKLQKSPSSSSSTKIVVGAVGLAACVYFIGRPKNPQVAAPAKTLLSKVEAKKATAVTPVSSAPEVKQSRQEYIAAVAAERREYTAISDIGLKSLNLTRTGSKLSVPVKLIPVKRWCMAGDIDTMKAAVGDVSKDNILISLEPEDGGQGDSYRTNVLSLYKATQHIFKIDYTGPRDRSFGLHICSDYKNGKSCQPKKMKTHEKISDDRAASEAKRTANLAETKFFFQHVVIAGDRMLSYGT